MHTQPTTDDLECQDGVMLDSGASACVCGMDWLQSRIPKKLTLMSSREIFRFGDGRGVPSLGSVQISPWIQSYADAQQVPVKFAADVIPGNMMMLISHEILSKWNSVIDFKQSTMSVNSIKLSLHRSTSGHLIAKVRFTSETTPMHSGRPSKRHWGEMESSRDGEQRRSINLE